MFNTCLAVFLMKSTPPEKTSVERKNLLLRFLNMKLFYVYVSEIRLKLLT